MQVDFFYILSCNMWFQFIKKEDKEMFDRLVVELTPQKKKFLLEQVKNLRLYSFCKSHSYSYAQLVYKLAYEKVHNPRKFWASTIKHTCSSYRKWVHLYLDRLKLLLTSQSNLMDSNASLNVEEEVSSHEMV